MRGSNTHKTLACLTAGAIAGGGRRNLLIGAGVGALAGGAVGNYMDRQDAKLRAPLRGTGVSVTRIGDQIVLNMPGNVPIQMTSRQISTGPLNSVAPVLNEFDKIYVDLVGHTDSTGLCMANCCSSCYG